MRRPALVHLVALSLTVAVLTSCSAPGPRDSAPGWQRRNRRGDGARGRRWRAGRRPGQRRLLRRGLHQRRPAGSRRGVRRHRRGPRGPGADRHRRRGRGPVGRAADRGRDLRLDLAHRPGRLDLLQPGDLLGGRRAVGGRVGRGDHRALAEPEGHPRPGLARRQARRHPRRRRPGPGHQPAGRPDRHRPLQGRRGQGGGVGSRARAARRHRRRGVRQAGRGFRAARRSSRRSSTARTRCRAGCSPECAGSRAARRSRPSCRSRRPRGSPRRSSARSAR